jgi:plastocyanin
MRRAMYLALGGLLLALLAAATAACGGGDDDGGNGANGGGGGARSPTAVATRSDDGDREDELKLVAKNTLWDKSRLEADAGEITIEVDNQDAGVVHNLHVHKGPDATGDDVGMTDLEAGPGQQSLTITVEPGEYFYVCDAHPATMAGKLTVE